MYASVKRKLFQHIETGQLSLANPLQAETWCEHLSELVGSTLSFNSSHLLSSYMLLMLIRWFTSAGICAQNDATGSRLVAGPPSLTTRVNQAMTVENRVTKRLLSSA